MTQNDVITSKKNPLIAHFSRLSEDGSYRRTCGEYVCEGVKLLNDALASGLEINNVLCTRSAALPELPELTKIHYASGDALATASYQQTPQGVLFTVPLPKVQGICLDTNRSYLLLDRVQDPGNVGTMLRTAEAFGFAGALLLQGCADPYSPKTLRGSMGAVFRLNICMLSALETFPLPIYAAVQNGEDVTTAEKRPCILAIGNEGQGLSSDIIFAAEKRVTIPMRGRAESLNAATAAAILMWELSK